MNTFIFDLDGTLLPMPDLELFIKVYFDSLSKKFVSYGIEPNSLKKAVRDGLFAMIKNDGSMTNEERFWQILCGIMGENAKSLEPIFYDFYKNEFSEARITTGTNPKAAMCIKLLKEKGYRVVLATNPVFPKIATYTRISWAGLDTNDFELITTYENSSYCKPNLKYYEEILSGLGRKARECIMVGNDVKEDMCASELGMDTFLLTECLINSENSDIGIYKHGNFDELLKMIRQLPDIA